MKVCVLYSNYLDFSRSILSCYKNIFSNLNNLCQEHRKIRTPHCLSEWHFYLAVVLYLNMVMESELARQCINYN